VVCEPEPLLIDTNVVIDLVQLGVLVDIARLPRVSLLLIEEVKKEVTRPEQVATLAAAIATGFVGETTLETLEEEAAYATLREVVGVGEAACLAVAHHRHLAVASDEVRPKFMREVKRLIRDQRLVRTPDLLAEAINAGLLSIDRLEGAVVALAATASSPRDRDDVAHLERVLGRIRTIMQCGGKP
jgi:predicted nucleic acid-binding protein